MFGNFGQNLSHLGLEFLTTSVISLVEKETILGIVYLFTFVFCLFVLISLAKDVSI